MESKTHRGLPIGGAENKFQSKVDIIIPFHGQYQKVSRLIASILRFTYSNPYTITLVDDCSPNSDYLDFHFSQTESKIFDTSLGDNFIRTPKRLGFAGACFHGFKNTQSPWVCFINSDCVIEDINWLKNMGDSLIDLKQHGVRMISPVTNNAVGGHDSQQMTKEKYMQTDGERPDIILDVKNKEENGESNPEYLSMYCFMCHRELFKRCGGFLREYPFGWYEDMEFAYRMNKHGFKQAVCRNSWIYHEGECTIKELWRREPKSRQIMEEENHKRCMDDLSTLFK